MSIITPFSASASVEAATAATTTVAGRQMFPIDCGGSARQGRRQYMEDKWGVETIAPGATVVWIADGHGGAYVCDFIATHIHNLLLQHCTSLFQSHGVASQDDISAQCTALFAALNNMLKDTKEAAKCGSTLVMAFIFPSRVVIASTGDSKACWGVEGNLLGQTCDHTCENETEVKRIEEAGGYVWWGRLFGQLTISRAIGDFAFAPHVICTPQVLVMTRIGMDTLILGSDGLFEPQGMDATTVVRMARRHALEGKSAQTVATLLTQTAITHGSGDNVTAVVVHL